MQAIVQDRYGDAPEDVLRLGEVPRPVAGDTEVVVHVHAASVDRGTWHVMAGVPYLIRCIGFGFRRPKSSNPGLSFAGTVEEVGDGVTRIAPGDEVYGTAPGSFAEYVAAPVGQVARKPSNVSFAEASTVPVSAVSALQAVRDCAHVQAGEKVLIVGASGGVGGFAVQLSKALGGNVTGVSGPSSLELVRTLGASTVIDYTREDFADSVHHYDVIIDTGGHSTLRRLRRALEPRGRLVIVGSENRGRWMGGFDRQLRARALSPFVSQSLGMLASTENAEDLDALRDLVEDGTVVVAIDRIYPLPETADAIRHLLNGNAHGKVVVEIT